MAFWTLIRLMLSGGLLVAAAACSPLQAPLAPISSETVIQQTRPAGQTAAILQTLDPTQKLTLPLTLKGTPDPSQAYPEAVRAAIQDLSSKLDIEPNQIAVISFHEETWPDGCLGLALPGEACLQALTPGYLVVLEASGNRYEYHTDETGLLLRLAGDILLDRLKPGLDVQKPRAILLAIEALNQSTGFPINDISLLSAQAAQWPNACPGLEKLDENCAEVVTEGWIIFLQAAGQQYEFHTDQSGEIIRQKKP